MKLHELADNKGEFIDEKKIDIKKPITEETLVESGLVRRVRDGVRLLAKGELKAKIDLTAVVQGGLNGISSRANGSQHVLGGVW